MATRNALTTRNTKKLGPWVQIDVYFEQQDQRRRNGWYQGKDTKELMRP